MSQEVSLDAEFDGDMASFLSGVREGRCFKYNGRPLPIPTAMVEGKLLLLPLPHRVVSIDMSRAISEAEHGNLVRVRLHFAR